MTARSDALMAPCASADLLVRSLVGKRASSVFPTAVRAALLAPTHAEATAINVAATGKGISQQTYDVLDAAAALWTGLRFADGRAVSYPFVPERFADGTTAAIWV